MVNNSCFNALGESCTLCAVSTRARLLLECLMKLFEREHITALAKNAGVNGQLEVRCISDSDLCVMSIPSFLGHGFHCLLINVLIN